MLQPGERTRNPNATFGEAINGEIRNAAVLSGSPRERVTIAARQAESFSVPLDIEGEQQDVLLLVSVGKGDAYNPNGYDDFLENATKTYALVRSQQETSQVDLVAFNPRSYANTQAVSTTYEDIQQPDSNQEKVIAHYLPEGEEMRGYVSAVEVAYDDARDEFVVAFENFSDPDQQAVVLAPGYLG